MSENAKTWTFVVVAVLMVAAVWLTSPLLTTVEEGDPRGKTLFPDFTDPLSANRLEITQYNDETGETVRFEVAQVDGIWSIPSHENYPADAAEHLGKVARELFELKILDVAGDEPGDQEEYGVLDPTDKELAPGTTGVGMRVVMKGAVADKDKKESTEKTLVGMIIGKEDPQQPEIRYVRRIDQEKIFTVKLDTSELSTKFDDWIEKDLLKLNVWDIGKLFFEDYKIDEMSQTLEQSGKFTVGFDDAAETKWSLADDFVYADGKWVSRKLGENEKVDQEKLDTLKNALADLKIVNVAKKPAGLSADLAAEKSFLNNAEAVESLMSCGFYVANVEGKPGVYSNMGETRVLMKDGVEYLLRFGHIASSSPSATAEGEEKDQDADTDASGVNRYLMVSTVFNPSVLEKPEPTPLPELKEGDEASKAERERVELENQQALDAYEEKVAEGKKRVLELNGRFADWYYVISESVFKKLRLSRKEMVRVEKPKQKKSPVAEQKASDTPALPTPELFQQLKGGPKGE